MESPRFADLARDPDPPLDALALALAGEFRDVDAGGARAALDALGHQLATAATGGPEEQARACKDVLGGAHGFTGDTDRYDAPRNSMLDVVLERRRGLPILLSVVYVEVARRASVPVLGVGLPGHFVVGHFGAVPPLLLDPFGGGAEIDPPADPRQAAPWPPHAIAMRMLNNLVAAHQRRGDLGAAIRAAELRLALPAADGQRTELEVEARALRARLN